MITPNYLIPGDTIALVAPAGIIKNKTAIEEAVSIAKEWGLHVVVGENVFAKNNHFAGSDLERLKDFQRALNDSKIKAIWCARGGYGSVRIIDQLDFTIFKKNPKWIIGYSDITVFHSHVHNLGFETLHAMMPVNFQIPEEDRTNSVRTLHDALFGKKIQYLIPLNSNNKLGVAEGIGVGGNLTLLENLLGTVSSINTENKILFIEEIGEYKYHIDRMLWALKRNGYFEKCAGLLVGGMTLLKKNDPSFGQSIEELILSIVENYSFPVVFDFPAGHDNENCALFLGRKIKLTATREKTTVSYLDC